MKEQQRVEDEFRALNEMMLQVKNFSTMYSDDQI